LSDNPALLSDNPALLSDKGGLFDSEESEQKNTKKVSKIFGSFRKKLYLSTIEIKAGRRPPDVVWP
jgi:hypothetical protein